MAIIKAIKTWIAKSEKTKEQAAAPLRDSIRLVVVKDKSGIR